MGHIYRCGCEDDQYTHYFIDWPNIWYDLNIGSWGIFTSTYGACLPLCVCGWSIAITTQNQIHVAIIVIKKNSNVWHWVPQTSTYDIYHCKKSKKLRGTGGELLISEELSWVVAAVLWYNCNLYYISDKALQQVLREQIFTKYGKSTKTHWDVSITGFHTRFCPVLSWHHLLFWIRFYCCVRIITYWFLESRCRLVLVQHITCCFLSLCIVLFIVRATSEE